VPELASLLPLLGIALLFWFLLIRPANRRQRELRRMQSSLAVGAEVILTSGIFGVVRSLDDDRVGIEIAPGVTIETARGAVGSVVTPSETEPLDDGDDGDDGGGEVDDVVEPGTPATGEER
jgi:preprotein translocase subunit YajC